MKAIGCFIFVFTVGTAVGGASPLAVVGTGVVLIVMVLSGRLFGGHCNPAVTLAVLLRHQVPSLEAVAYMLAQVGAGFLGAVAVGTVIDPTRLASAEAVTLSGQTLLAAFAIELLFSFALCFVLLDGAGGALRPGSAPLGLTAGFVLFAGALALTELWSGTRIDPGPAVWVYLMVQVITGPAATVSFLASNLGDR